MLLFIIVTQICFAQYTFKHGVEITELVEINESTLSVSRSVKGTPDSEDSNSSGFISKRYRTNLGDTVTITPKIAIILKNDSQMDEIIAPFQSMLSFKKKIGKASIFNCYVDNSDRVLEITTALSKNESIWM